MQIPQDAVLLRIFIGESDRHRHQPLYEAIVLKAREMQMAGATVLRGPMGFGKSSHLHTAKILRLSMDLPIVIEIVDSEEKVNAFLPVLDEIMGGGLVTLEKAKVIRYQDQEKEVTNQQSRSDCRLLQTAAIRHDADWKLRVFKLEVTSDGGRIRDSNDYIFKRSAEERSNCHRRELLQFARRKVAYEARGPARGISSKNSRADYQ